MSLIKSYVFSIQEMGFDPYHLNKLSSEEWDNLLTKALKSDKKLYETLILTRCKLKGKKYFESQVPFSNLSEVEEPF